MNQDAFSRRVLELRDTWDERRQVRTLAGAHDFESQSRLLLVLHRWASQAATAVNDVYGTSVQAYLSPPPQPGERTPGFSLAIAPGYSLTFALASRQRGATQHWYVSASFSAGQTALATPAGPHRRSGQWNRGRLEDLVLSVLGAYERSRSGEVQSL